MYFSLLGALEVVDHGIAVRLGSPKQRSTLGFLLLHANTVVPTSRLMTALWGEDAPPTARKMLQNAVCGIRGILAEENLGNEGDSTPTAALLTHAPGYLLRVEPEALDLTRFQRLTEQGRADLATGSWDQAADKLRTAVNLWRGPALADLVETGMTWPELTAVQNGQIAAWEDLVEADLACGRHHEAISELEALVAAEPLRERLCGQLMRALYRSGRQADAVAVYRRTRTLLREKLGIEPGHELRDLHQGILDHDAALSLPRVATAVPERIAIPEQRRPEVCERAPRDVTAERRGVTAVVVVADTDEDDPEYADDEIRALMSAIDDQITAFGGLVHSSAGPITLGLFGTSRTREDDAERAVRAAMALSERFTSSLRITVTTGETLVRRTSEASAPLVSSQIMDNGLQLLTQLSPGDVRVCDVTRNLTERVFQYASADTAWDLTGIRETPVRPTAPLIDRDRELRLLRDLVEEVGHTRTPQLVTVLGDAGIGKTRLVAELAATIPGGTEFLTLDAPAPCLLDRPRTSAPLVVTFEDLHRADDALLDFVQQLPERAGSAPLLVVATARPELRWLRPAWGGGRRTSTTITLSPLSEIGTSRLLDALLAPTDSRSARNSTGLLKRIGGNPFFAEEYVRAIGTGWCAEFPTLTHALRGIIAARLDTLPAEAKTVLQNAAVVGATVWSGALSAIGDGSDVAQCLDLCERRELLRRSATSSMPGEVEYTFRQAGVLDVAYHQLPVAARAEKHRRAAMWLNAQSVARPDLLAHHFGQAVRLSAASDGPTAQLAEWARTALAGAAGRAAASGDHPAAVHCYRTAVELSASDDPMRPHLVQEYRKSLAKCAAGHRVLIPVGDVAPGSRILEHA